MSCPRVEVDLRKIRHNTRTIVGRLNARGICVNGVTKAVAGHPAIARAMLDGGVTGLAEARLRNAQRLRKAGITCPITLIRTPMLSQAGEVVKICEASYNTEITVIAGLAAAAIQQSKVHGVILMVEMGDLREGIMPQDLYHIAQQVVDLPGVALEGIGANFACLSNFAPDAAKMQSLSTLANDIEGQCGRFLQTVSGGNSANLPWALAGHATGRINQLRLGEAILLGVDPVSGSQIDGMYRDAFTLVAEVIETNTKLVCPTEIFADLDLSKRRIAPNSGHGTRVILAIGQQDTDISGLSLPPGSTLIGATSDHLVIGIRRAAPLVGSDMRFQMNYGALMRATAAPDVQTYLRNDRPAPNPRHARDPNKHLTLV
ncbi:alanine/ornithine racemase family PLP-dependent enzyme [Litoreibacter janthinus]|uniref:Predicted amino acid racemase n=1 Tax=Litoreibacter janthinus TaxID=670154 RepID=A0A1I6GA43_9RHOB|nr:alanine/ornithine racemase family PLP-dependent enzyme [Litoreibacter janthinus]SFR39076.1 Predicted amino acid racemase [Litoreibacter janthinus]